MKVRIVWKFFAAFTLITIVTAVILSSFLVAQLKKDAEAKISQRLHSNTILTGEIFKRYLPQASRVEIQKEVKSLAQRLQLRITVIDKQGTVLADSETDPAIMENHSDRIEFIKAVQKGLGESTRFSNTLKLPMKYVAVSITDGNDIIGIVRIAVALSDVQLELQKIYRAVFVGSLGAICSGLIIAYFMARGISRPISRMRRIAEQIAQGNFEEKVIVKSNDELADLANALSAMADELQVKMERLKYMDRVRTDFVANVSHELKTPLTSIRGFVETLEDGAIDEKDNATRFLAIIKKHTQRLGNIIEDLLKLSELESGIAVEMEVFNLKSLAEEVVMGFGHALSVKKQKLTVETSEDDFSIKADRNKLEQVLVNLIDNSLKYTGNGGQIKIKLVESGNDIVFTVEDNGIGISNDDIERVFERFYRVDKARSRELGGTGLGLSIAKHIVLAHKGNICIDSDLGKGTKVLVTLPKNL